MIGLAAGTRIWIVAEVNGHAAGFVGLSGMDRPPGGNRFQGRGACISWRRGDLIKMLWWDGDGLCLFPSGSNAANLSIGRRLGLPVIQILVFVFDGGFRIA